MTAIYHTLKVSLSPRDIHLQGFEGEKQSTKNTSLHHCSYSNAVPLLTEGEGGKQETYKAHKNVHFEAIPTIFNPRTLSNSSESRKDCTMINLPLSTCRKNGRDLLSRRMPGPIIPVTSVEAEEWLEHDRTSVARTESKRTMRRSNCMGHDSSESPATLQTADTDINMAVCRNLVSRSHWRNPSVSEEVEELGSEEEVELALKLEHDSSTADADSFSGPDLATLEELTLSTLEEAEEEDLGLQFDHSRLVKASRQQRQVGHDVVNKLTQILQHSDRTIRRPRIHFHELLKVGVGHVYGKIIEPGSIHRGKKFYFSKRR